MSLGLLAGCGMVEQRITPSYENLRHLSTVDAVAALREIAPYANHPYPNQRIYEITDSQMHVGTRWIPFEQVRTIEQRGLIGSSSDVEIRLLDGNDMVLVEFRFWGTYVYHWPFRWEADNPEGNPVYQQARNDPSIVSRFLSALLSVCPNVR